jgi:hypothetical protein
LILGTHRFQRVVSAKGTLIGTRPWDASLPVPGRLIRLPGELQAWRDTAIYTKVQGFVVRIRDCAIEWVDVKRGASMNYQGVDLVEIFGHLESGDQVAVRGADELRVGVKVNVK